jgi:hypothetical protein
VLVGIAEKNRFTFGVEGIVPFIECVGVIHPKGRNIAPHGRKQFIGIFHGHDIQVAMGKTVHMIVRGILQFDLQSRPEPFFDFFLGLPQCGGVAHDIKINYLGSCSFLRSEKFHLE